MPNESGMEYGGHYDSEPKAPARSLRFDVDWTKEEVAAIDALGDKLEMTPEQVIRQAVREYELRVVPHWEFGKASSNGCQVPTCSKCGWAINGDTDAHEAECWTA